jgi:osmotically inducible protein OsmC
MKSIMRRVSVRWDGDSEAGTQISNSESSVLNQARVAVSVAQKPYPATDPGELIAAAHAGSFSLALSKELEVAGSVSGSIVNTATAMLEYLAAGWTIMKIQLNVLATLPKITQNEFIDATVRAKTSCPVSRLLRANISMNAKLE